MSAEQQPTQGQPPKEKKGGLWKQFKDSANSAGESFQKAVAPLEKKINGATNDVNKSVATGTNGSVNGGQGNNQAQASQPAPAPAAQAEPAH